MEDAFLKFKNFKSMEKKKKGYSEEDVLRSIRRKADLRIVGKQIQELKEGKGDVGNGTRGKIDFLIKYCGYVHYYVNDFKN